MKLWYAFCTALLLTVVLLAADPGALTDGTPLAASMHGPTSATSRR